MNNLPSDIQAFAEIRSAADSSLVFVVRDGKWGNRYNFQKTQPRNLIELVRLVYVGGLGNN